MSDYKELLDFYQQRLNISRDIAGYGIPFPYFHDPISGSTTINTDFDRINQSIYTILSTTKGERVMSPDFGSNLYKLLFESINEAFIQFAIITVREALAKWEPRIKVLDVGIYEYTDRPYVIGIKIDYEVLMSKAVNNYVYPYDMNKSRIQ